MINMWARILIFDPNLTKTKYGNRVLETYLSLGIKQFTSKNCPPILWIFTVGLLLSSILFSVFLFMHLTTKVIRIKVSSYESVIDRKLKLGTWEKAIWSNPGYLTSISKS